MYSNIYIFIYQQPLNCLSVLAKNVFWVFVKNIFWMFDKNIFHVFVRKERRGNGGGRRHQSASFGRGAEFRCEHPRKCSLWASGR